MKHVKPEPNFEVPQDMSPVGLVVVRPVNLPRFVQTVNDDGFKKSSKSDHYYIRKCTWLDFLMMRGGLLRKYGNAAFLGTEALQQYYI